MPRRAGSSSASAGSTFSFSAPCSRCPEWHYSCVLRRGGGRMDHRKFSEIAHRDHAYCNPISAAKIERLLDLLPLDESSRVLDLGCGRAELALRIIERFGARVMAVDNSSLLLDAARERAEWTGALGRLHIDNVDIAEFQADPET